MDFTVVTPSFGMLPYLRCAAASVADQAGVSAEHWVVDGGSQDGTVSWLAANPQIRSLSEPDGGMYDALNKGFSRATGEILGYLNCDEQYLPGTLGRVRAYFARHPEVDLLVGDALLVRPDGTLVSFRKTYPPRWSYIATAHLDQLSCAMFFRRQLWGDGFRFDPRWRAVGDMDFFGRILRAGRRAGHLPEFLSSFTCTGSNLGGQSPARHELLEFRRSAPLWLQCLSRPTNLLRRAEKAARGAYFQTSPIRYAVYPLGADRRREFTVSGASFRWPAD